MTVNFWSFSKKVNSTSFPSGTPLYSATAYLKEESGVLSPTLQIYDSAAWNPYNLNYAQITDFSRYYFAGDWIWTGGVWETTLEVDALASWKTGIGSTTKYVLRSAYSYDPDLIDDFYPALFAENEIAQEYDFGFDIGAGEYVVGVVNRQPTHVGGMVSYYRMTQTTMDEMRRAMYPTPTDYFEDISMITGDVIRSIIDPWQYIVGCKKFPIAIPHDTLQSAISFGQWESSPSSTDRMIGWRLSDISSWGSLTHDFTIATNWLQRDARERCGPGTRIFVVCNPWGAIQLSPADFSDSSVIRLEILPDFITGDAFLKVYSVKGPLQTLVAQRTAKIGIDTTIASTRINALGGLASGVQAVGAAFAGGNLAGAVSGVASATEQMTPSLAGSTALQEGMRSLEGIARLIVRTPRYPGSDVADHGRPLCQSAQISTLPGFIKCADGEFQAAGCMKEELDKIAEFLTGGFFYE